MVSDEEIHRTTVRRMTGLRNHEIDELVEARRFPYPSSDNERWLRSDVLKWLKARTG